MRVLFSVVTFCLILQKRINKTKSFVKILTISVWISFQMGSLLLDDDRVKNDGPSEREKNRTNRKRISMLRDFRIDQISHIGSDAVAPRVFIRFENGEPDHLEYVVDIVLE